MADRRPVLAALALLLNAFVWGVAWWPFRELQARGVHPLWATALVYIASMAVLVAYRPFAIRDFFRHPSAWVLLAAAGMTNVGFNWAVTIGDVVRVVLLFYLMPAWSVVLAWPLLGERPTGGSVLRLLIAMAGVVIVLKSPEAPWPVPEGLADWLALAGGFSFALNNVMLRRLQQVPAPARILAMFAGGASMATAAALLGAAAGTVPGLPPLDAPTAALGLLLSLGFLSGNIALQYGASHLAAHAAALIMLSEIVFASLSSVVAGASVLTTRTLLGGSLILLAAAGSAWPGSTREPSGAQ